MSSSSVPRFEPGVEVSEVISHLDEHGYALVESVLSTEEVASKRQELARLAAETPTGRNDFEGFHTRRVYALFAKTRTFDDLALHPLMLGPADELLGQNQLSAPVGLTLGPGETVQPPHYDDAIYPLPWPHQHVVLNTVWSLCDFTEANGGTGWCPTATAGPAPAAPATTSSSPLRCPRARP